MFGKGAGARPADGELRTIVVRSPSMLAEAGVVLRVVFHIVFWSAALMGLERGATETGAARPAALPAYEVGFRDLDGADQRVFRALQEGLGEAEDARTAGGAWPTVEALAARHIPPFAVDPIDHAGFRWRLLIAGHVVNYLGVPDPASGRPTFDLVVLEPEPGTPVDPTAVVDEIHHRLRDGTLIHVAIYTAPGVHALDAPSAAPGIEDGWRRITMTTTSPP